MARFCEIASRDIKNVALSAQDDVSIKRLTIFAAGYQYLDEGSRPWYFRVSNFEGEELYSKPKQLPDDDCSLVWATQRTPTTTPYGFVVAGDTTRGIPSGSMLQLRRLVTEKRPPRALVDKAVEVIQAAADAPASGDTKGNGSSWIFEPCLTWANVLRRVQQPAFSLVRSESNARASSFQRIPRSPAKLNITQPTWLGRSSYLITSEHMRLRVEGMEHLLLGVKALLSKTKPVIGS
jgi:hypothetical protein